MSIKIRKIADEVTVKIGCSYFCYFFSFFIRSQSINVLAPQIQKSKNFVLILVHMTVSILTLIIGRI